MLRFLGIAPDGAEAATAPATLDIVTMFYASKQAGGGPIRPKA
jgi:hypothetical protein